MKKLLFILTFAVSYSSAQEAALEVCDVPFNVFKSFNTLYPDHGESVNWSINRYKHFVVRTEINNHEAMVVFKEDGSFILIDEKIPVDEISDSARLFFRSQHEGLKIIWCNRIKTYLNITYEMMSGYYDNDVNKRDFAIYPDELPLAFLEEREFLL